MSGTAQAQMTLTQTGLNRGFALTTFATGFPSSGGIGPIAVDYQPDGTTLVGSNVDNRIVRFNNADNQTYGGATATAYPATEFPHGIAHFGPTVYVSRYNSQTIVQLNADGSINRTVASNLGNARALVANNATGHLLTSCVQGLRDVDPATGAFTTIAADESDGITLSPDGTIVYGAVISGGLAGRLVGWNIATHQVVFQSAVLPGTIDGTALGFNQFAGYIYANTNAGTVLEIDLNNPNAAPAVIATGGSRGDFVSSDPTGSGDMLLTQSDRVLRLHGIPAPASRGRSSGRGSATGRRKA
jgi:hypothetical protein